MVKPDASEEKFLLLEGYLKFAGNTLVVLAGAIEKIEDINLGNAEKRLAKISRKHASGKYPSPRKCSSCRLYL